MKKLTLLFLLVTYQAASETIKITSGDHQNFTRLVAALPDSQTSWNLERIGTGYELEIDRADISFDLERVFDLIGRDRVVSLESQSNRLIIELGCNCGIDTFVTQNRFLVLDIVKSTSPPQEVLPSSKPPNSPSLSFAELSLATPPASPVQLKLNFGQTPTDALRSAKKDDSPKPAVSSLKPLPLPEAVGLADRKSVLVDGVLRATSHGLLSPNPSRIGKKRTSEPAEISGVTQLESPHIAISSATDRSSLSAVSNLSEKSRHSCNQTPEVDLFDWGFDASYADQLSTLRAQVTTELYGFSDSGLRDLAKGYIFFGFGQEAISGLYQIQNRISEDDALTTLAQMMDQKSIGTTSYFFDQQHCSSANALWALLTTPADLQTEPANVQTILSTLTDLPLHLRVQLAPRVSEVFKNLNETVAAAKALRVVDNSVIENRTAHTIARAEIALGTGEQEQAVALLNSVVENGSDESAVTLARLASNMFDQGKMIEPQVASDLGAYAIEYRLLPEGAEIRNAHALARAGSGDFESAYLALAEIRTRDGDASWKNAISGIAERATIAQADADFLADTLQYIIPNAQMLPSETVNKLASRLQNMGFNDAAGQLAQIGADGAIGRERRLLRARIALASNKPLEAEGHLMGLSGEDVLHMQAEALIQKGRIEQARELYLSLNDPQKASKMAWRSNNWTALQNSEAETFRQVSEILLATNPIDQDTVPTLNNSALVIAESKAARATIDTLLETYQLETALPPN